MPLQNYSSGQVLTEKVLITVTKAGTSTVTRCVFVLAFLRRLAAGFAYLTIHS
jgi:hypothetical protein